jgi:phospholipid-transporting ATPase
VCKKKLIRGEKMKVMFSTINAVHMNGRNSNKIVTSRYLFSQFKAHRYTLINWAPKSLAMQFKRAANIYFLVISVLTSMPFSPKVLFQ